MWNSFSFSLFPKPSHLNPWGFYIVYGIVSSLEMLNVCADSRGGWNMLSLLWKGLSTCGFGKWVECWNQVPYSNGQLYLILKTATASLRPGASSCPLARLSFSIPDGLLASLHPKSTAFYISTILSLTSAWHGFFLYSCYLLLSLHNITVSTVLVSVKIMVILLWHLSDLPRKPFRSIASLPSLSLFPISLLPLPLSSSLPPVACPLYFI